MRIPRRQLQPFTHRWPVGQPPVWIILIAANVGFFLVQKLIEYTDPDWTRTWLGLSGEGVGRGFLWQFVTYTFLHGSVLHLLGNMFLLYFAGSELEPLVGARHFIAIYFGGGVAGGITQLAAVQWGHLAMAGPLMGASACVFAVLIAFTTILPELELTWLLFYIVPVRLRAKHLAFIAVGASVGFICFHVFNNIGHFAHLGGCSLGWAYVKQLGYGNPLRIQRYFLEKRQRAERHKHMSSAQFITEEIDPILEKISRDGIKSLTRSERRILQMGREKIENGRR